MGQFELCTDRVRVYILQPKGGVEMKTVNVLLIGCLLGLANIVYAQEQECGPCDTSKCPETGVCPGGTTMDFCGCCEVCSRRLSELCDLPKEPVKYGICGDYLVCKPRTDVIGQKENTCQCLEEGEVCGSDGKGYESVCALLEETVNVPDLIVSERSPCKTAPVIKSSPEDSTRPIGGIMVLDCEAVGYPVPDVIWELIKPDGSSMKLPSDDSAVAVQVRGGPEKHMVTGWVQIMEVTKKTAGTYVCIASNSEGEDRKAATIKLSDKSKSGVNEL